MNILIVDDQAPVRDALRAYLQLALPHYTIREAEDGHSTWSELRRLLPRLVLMDVNLPDVSGIALTRQIKKSFPKLPIVMVTQHSIAPYIEDALVAGASGYVIKEAVQRDLLPVVMRVLGQAGTVSEDDGADTPAEPVEPTPYGTGGVGGTGGTDR